MPPDAGPHDEAGSPTLHGRAAGHQRPKAPTAQWARTTLPLVTLRTTPLHGQHRAAGAKLADFGGWDMPIEYTGVVAEHTAVRTSVGAFDVSHMGKLVVSGR